MTTLPTFSTCNELMELIARLGFLPLLNSPVPGFSAEEMADYECRYHILPGGGWEWPLWKWKGPAVTEGDCVYGKFFEKKAGFVSREWWPHFRNYRRSCHPRPVEGSVEEAILETLRVNGSMITRELRAACGFNGPKMRSRFDGYVTRLQMGCRVVTEDFVYPRDRHNNPYGWGWSLLTTPEALFPDDDDIGLPSPEESLQLMLEHLREILPHATEAQLMKMLG